MQFDSYIYALFLPIVFCIYWALKNRLFWQNLFLLTASYLFYGWWDWRFLGLIIITSLSTFFTGLAIEKSHRRTAKMWCTFNIVLNLGILATFKYFNFFRDTFVDCLGVLGINADFPTVNLILPIGISFYTLQALSYTIDVYRRKVPATSNIVAFMVYIAFFPQLVAGPIERASNLLPQFLKKKEFDYYTAVIGMRQILWGLVKKLVIADNLAGYVDNMLYHPSIMSASSIVLAAVIFAFQIYADFSGYSDIAIGSARLLNIKLSANFRFPFFSRSMKELWQRWHISLMTWFREYVYFPLGGSRKGKLRTCINIMIVFAVSGLWHGADWTYVIWGLSNGLLLLPFVFLPKNKYKNSSATWRDIPKCLITLFLFAILCIAFRSPNIAHFKECLSVVISSSIFTMPINKTTLIYIVPFVIVEWFGRHQEFPIMTLRVPTVVRWAIYWGLLFLIAFYSAGKDIQYIYFQF